MFFLCLFSNPPKFSWRTPTEPKKLLNGTQTGGIYHAIAAVCADVQGTTKYQNIRSLITEFRPNTEYGYWFKGFKRLPHAHHISVD